MEYVPEKRRMGHGSDRAGRLFQIQTILLDAGSGACDSVWLTSYQIAHRMGLKPSQYQRQMLYELVEEGVVSCFSDELPSGHLRYCFAINEAAFSSARWREAWEAFNPSVQMTPEGVR